MSALPGQKVGQLFSQHSPSSGASGVGSFNQQQQESRSSYDMGGSKKKKRAPPPPAGLGQYKPKILSDHSAVNVPVNRPATNGAADAPVRPPRRGDVTQDNTGVDSSSNNGDSNGGGSNKAFIIGDKDTPMVIHPAGSRDSNRLDLHVGKLSLTPDELPGQEGSLGTSNPLFHLHHSAQHNGGTSPPSSGRDKPSTGDDPEAENDEPNGVYIPEPDYDEEEKTMVFPDDDEDDYPPGLQPEKKVYKEYYGEDFSQYLSDEESGVDVSPRYRPKRGSRTGSGSHSGGADRKSRTEGKRSLYRKRGDSLPSSKSKKDKAVSGSNSLRTFSFADSKFGTLRGSSGKRHSVPSLSEDTGEEAERFVTNGSSYERFLRSRNGEELGDVFYDDSQGVGEGSGAGFVPGEVPSRYLRPSDKKDNLWKKLTWKFKRQARKSLDLSTSQAPSSPS